MKKQITFLILFSVLFLVSTASSVANATETPPVCTSWAYSDWSSCDPNLGNQERSVISSFPSNCIEGSGSPISRQRCIPECISSSWSCDSWGACSSSGMQHRSCTGAAYCQGGVPSPVTSQSCTPIPQPKQIPITPAIPQTPVTVADEARCHSLSGAYAEVKNGICGCKDGYQQFSGFMCQTITLACQTWRIENDPNALICPYKNCGGTYINGQCVDPKKEATEKKAEEDAKNTRQCIASRGENAEYKNSWCGCKDGYQTYTGSGKCQNTTEACQTWYGVHSKSTTADSTTCACEPGYILSDKQCVPLTQPVSAATATTPPVTILPSPVSTVIPKPLITTPIKKKPQPSTESEVKTPPLSEITATTTRQEQITTSPTEAPEIVRPVPAPIIKQENVFQRVWKKFLSWF